MKHQKSKKALPASKGLTLSSNQIKNLKLVINSPVRLASNIEEMRARFVTPSGEYLQPVIIKTLRKKELIVFDDTKMAFIPTKVGKKVLNLISKRSKEGKNATIVGIPPSIITFNLSNYKNINNRVKLR